MKTFILKWNPSISSLTMEEMEMEIECIADDPEADENWSVHEWEQLEAGDRFFLLRVGRGKTGIMASGYFTGRMCEDKSWHNDGTMCHYADLIYDVMIFPQRNNILTTKELLTAIPDVDWKGGHSGVVITAEQAETLEQLWKTFLKENAGMFKDNELAWISMENRAYCIAMNAHRGQVDKAGKDYFEAHIKDVYNRSYHYENYENNPDVERIDANIVALLHDVVEDTPWTIEALREEGFSEVVLTALQCVTKREGESYDQFIDRILPNPIARIVKKCDLESNMTITRLNEITDTDVERLRKYLKAYKRIVDYKKE